MYGLPRRCKFRGRSDDDSLLKCIRPLASELRLQPGHDEIRTPRSHMTSSGSGPLSAKGLRSVDQLSRHHNLEPRSLLARSPMPRREFADRRLLRAE